MKKAYLAILLVALFGCDEDDVKAAAKGKTDVFALNGYQIEGFPMIDDGYHTIDEIKSLAPSSNLPSGSKNDLENKGISVHKESCAKLLPKSGSELCFDNEKKICLPKEFKYVGLKVFTIDLDKLQTAKNSGFYQIDVARSYPNLSYETVSCSALK